MDSTPSKRELIGSTALAFALGAAGCGLCGWAAGLSLGWFFGGVAVAMLLLPGLTLAQRNGWAQALVYAGVVDGVAMVWLAGVLRGISLGQWIECYALLAACGLAVWGLAALLRRAGCGAVAAAAITVVAGMLWLSAPVWLAPWLSERVAGILAPVHPLLALNGIFGDRLGIWTQMGILYQFTTLGQDVAYALPRNCTWAIIGHLLIGSGLWPALADARGDQ